MKVKKKIIIIITGNNNNEDKDNNHNKYMDKKIEDFKDNKGPKNNGSKNIKK